MPATDPRAARLRQRHRHPGGHILIISLSRQGMEIPYQFFQIEKYGKHTAGKTKITILSLIDHQPDPACGRPDQDPALRPWFPLIL